MESRNVPEGAGAFARVKTYIATRGGTDIAMRSRIRQAEVDEEIAGLAMALDRRLDRDASYGLDVLLRCNGASVKVTPASSGMCTVVRGSRMLAADLVLDEHTVVDLNALESGSIRVYDDIICFHHVDGTLIEIVTVPGRQSVQ